MQPSLGEEIGKRDPFELLEQEVSLNLLRTLDSLQSEFHQFFSAHGLSGPQYNVLRILRGHGGDGVASQVIASQMITRTPDITRLVDRLAEAGLVCRAKTSQDRRVVLVCITPAGLELLARIDQPLLDLHRRQLSHMGRDELETLNRLLVRARSRVPTAESPS
jgi:DNA-binding MarR family transcriptional regulator